MTCTARSSPSFAVGGVAFTLTLVPPCPPHQWAHAPTVGYYTCIRCQERVDHRDARYARIARGEL